MFVGTRTPPFLVTLGLAGAAKEKLFVCQSVELLFVIKYQWFVYVFFLFILGIDFKIKTVELQGKKIKLQIW